MSLIETMTKTDFKLWWFSTKKNRWFSNTFRNDSKFKDRIDYLTRNNIQFKFDIVRVEESNDR